VSAQSGSSFSGESRAVANRKVADQKILLGDIASVPFQELYETLARQKPEEIAGIAQQLDVLPNSQETRAKIKAFFASWAHLDPAAALASAVGFQTKETRAAAINATIAGADAHATGAIALPLDKMSDDVLSGSVRSGLFDQAVGKWSEADPAGAAQLLTNAHVAGMGLTAAFYAVGLNWGATDPAAALAWAEQQHQVPFGLSPVNGVVQGWWKKDPAAAEEYALTRAGTPDGEQLIGNMVMQMANEDQTKASEWVARLPAGKLREQAYRMLATQLSFNDPKGASAWALTLPAEAAVSAVESTVSIWARTDPSGAARWVEGLSGKIRDGAASSYSYAVAEADPAAAAAWAITISDEEKRKTVLRRATSQWLERDPAAARAWVQNSSLGEDEKVLLLSNPQPSP
jgi:hypothetical protein